MPHVTVQDSDRGIGLTLDPLRGLRYAPSRVSSLAAVTSPPYDVLDADAVVALESADPHNVVRLILPRDEESGPEGRYQHAAQTLRAWTDDGVLVPDRDPGLYVYEQSFGGEVTQRGLLGAIGLRDPDQHIVLPHEDVMPGPVADRLELMRAARANVEPILLMYDGGDVSAQIVDRRADDGEPLLAVTGTDGVTHRLWTLNAPADLLAVGEDLRHRQALIADGHHRYAAYRLLQDELRRQSGPGPWDSGLALLVDLRAHPPRVGAIHRTVDDLTLMAAVRAASDTFAVEHIARDRVLDRLADLTVGELLLLDHQSAAVLTVARPRVVEEQITRQNPAEWVGLDTAVLHQVLIEDLWHRDDSTIGYHHDPEQALAYAQRQPAVAVLLAPVPVERVLEIAAKGVRMPRKSTSFGPKPRTGFVLRSFDLS